MPHHTKDKGDIGLGAVIGSLLEAGIQVALPISEHLPFDLIAISADGRMRRVQVKYRSAAGGKIVSGLRSTWSDSNGWHSRLPDPSAYDVLAVFCPDPRMICYLMRAELDNSVGGSVTLRLDRARNGQTSGVRMATDFVDPARIFSSVEDLRPRQCVPSGHTGQISQDIPDY